MGLDNLRSERSASEPRRLPADRVRDAGPLREVADVSPFRFSDELPARAMQANPSFAVVPPHHPAAARIQRLEMGELQRLYPERADFLAGLQARREAADLNWKDGLYMLATLSDGEVLGGGGVSVSRHHRSTDPVAGRAAALWGIYVRPEARRLGVGAQLIERLSDHAGHNLGCDVVLLRVGDRQPAVNVYGQLGFQRIGPLAMNPEDDDTAFGMMREIDKGRPDRFPVRVRGRG
jgi:GNAT superfamily N-acetyltransferase